MLKSQSLVDCGSHLHPRGGAWPSIGSGRPTFWSLRVDILVERVATSVCCATVALGFPPIADRGFPGKRLKPECTARDDLAALTDYRLGLSGIGDPLCIDLPLD